MKIALEDFVKNFKLASFPPKLTSSLIFSFFCRKFLDFSNIFTKLNSHCPNIDGMDAIKKDEKRILNYSSSQDCCINAFKFSAVLI